MRFLETITAAPEYRTAIVSRSGPILNTVTDSSGITSTMIYILDTRGPTQSFGLTVQTPVLSDRPQCVSRATRPRRTRFRRKLSVAFCEVVLTAGESARTGPQMETNLLSRTKSRKCADRALSFVRVELKTHTLRR